MTLDNYGQVETANSKAPLILIEYEIFISEKKTTKVAISKLWPVYCISSI